MNVCTHIQYDFHNPPTDNQGESTPDIGVLLDIVMWTQILDNVGRSVK